MTFTCQASLSWLFKNVILLQIWLHLISFWLSTKNICFPANASKNTNKLEGHHLLELLTNTKISHTTNITDLRKVF